MVNQTQDILAQLGGLYWIQTYRIDVCDYFALRQAVQEGQRGVGPYVIEASWDGGCNPDSSCVAAYLLAATEYTYLGCLAGGVENLPRQDGYYADIGRPLGPPLGDAAEDAVGVWSRNFTHGATARWYPDLDAGTTQWPGQPLPPAPASRKIGAGCGRILTRSTFVGDLIAPPQNGTTPQDCCDSCRALSRDHETQHCVGWVWFKNSAECNLHGRNAVSQNTYPTQPTICQQG